MCQDCSLCVSVLFLMDKKKRKEGEKDRGKGVKLNIRIVAQEEGFSERTVLCFSKDRSPDTNDHISAIVTSQTFII